MMCLLLTIQSAITAATPPLRGPLNEISIALWLDGIGGAFDGWSYGGSGTMVAPRVLAPWDDPNDGSHVGTSGICLHGGNEAVFTPTVEPESVNGSWQLSNLQERNGKFVLPVPDEGVVYSGSATLHSGKLRFGTLRTTFYAHRCDSSYSPPLLLHLRPLPARRPLPLRPVPAHT